MRTIFSNERYEGSLLLELIKAADKYAANAHRYGYTAVLDKTAEVVLSLPFNQFLLDTFTSPRLLRRFVLYRNQWIEIRNRVIDIMSAALCIVHHANCLRYNMIMAAYLSQVAADLRNAVKIPELDYAVRCASGGREVVFRCDCEWSEVVVEMQGHKQSIKNLSEIVP
ncbi:hypothetical protein CPB83DRAFT_882686 [Crepidotus variabilis]|uniref:Uncharacterized protein n=1 Tax=Crepidotus variabilis TaxID=179855 RepID=A0A9P6EJF3_9AGAR|nr:hypothetical protein CPB83DRAFT_882686 [Crepidotus variabilis]